MSKEPKIVSKILIPTDGSNYSMKAAEYAIRLAKCFGAEIVTIYVIDQVVLNEISKVKERSEVEKEMKEKAERYLNHIVRTAKKEGLKANSIIVEGQPHGQIVRYAKSMGADLIAMGTRGRRGAERILIGSVAERVIEYAPCPVLVLR